MEKIKIDDLVFQITKYGTTGPYQVLTIGLNSAIIETKPADTWCRPEIAKVPFNLLSKSPDIFIFRPGDAVVCIVNDCETIHGIVINVRPKMLNVLMSDGSSTGKDITRRFAKHKCMIIASL